MSMRDSSKTYGWITRLCHWSIAIAIFVQYYLVYRREYFAKDSPEKLQYILLHKSIGMTVLAVGLFYLLWRIKNTRPHYPVSMPRWEKRLATVTRYFLFASVVLMPLGGYLMSMSKGRTVSWFGVFDWPYLGNHEAAGKLFYLGHVYWSYVLIGLVALHIAGALKHQFISKDSVVKKMVGW